MINRSGICRNCNCTTPWVLHKQVFANRTEHYLYVCSRCNCRGCGPRAYVPHREVESFLSPSELASLPVILPGGNVANTTGLLNL